MEETYTQQATAAPTAEAEATEALATVHKLKLKPPTYDGNYSTFEEWKYKFTAYMGIQDPTYPQLMERAERATSVLVEADLRTAAGTTQEAESWIQLSTNLKYILITITSGSAATAVRQHQQEIGLEVYRQLCVRFSTPLGTRSIGYLTKLLKPTFDHNNFEESFSNWEFELQRYEAANTTRLPDPVKIAVLMNETKGPLQQHLHLNAGASPTYAQIRATIMEYYRTTMAFTRLQQQSSAVSSNLGGGTAPMDIGATYKGAKGKGKGKNTRNNKGKGKGYNNKGKGYGYGKGYGMNNKGKAKGKQHWQPIQQNKGYKGKGKNKGDNKGKGKNPMSGCYICGQPGHLARDCRTTVYNVSETQQEQAQDATGQWYEQQNGYDAYWYNSDATGYTGYQQYPQQLALPAPPPHQTQTVQENNAPAVHSIHTVTPPAQQHSMTASFVNAVHSDNKVEIMIDSGAATHVCPTWFAPDSPLYTLQQGQGPNLRTATDESITIHGYKWVLMTNQHNYRIAVPFYVCDVRLPIMSVTRLTEQGFDIQFTDNPTMSHSKGFHANLVQRAELFYLPMQLVNIPGNMRLEVNETDTAYITPVTITPTGMEIVRNRNDTWTFNSQGFLVRTHRTTRKALFVPDSRCPIPTERLENYRRTIVHRQNGNNEDFEDKYQDLNKSQQNRVLQGQTWTGETWFRVKRGTPLPGNTPPPPKALPSQATHLPGTASTSKSAANPQQPLTRHTTKKPIDTNPQPQQQRHCTPMRTSVPHPKDVRPTTDYWVKEGHMWKRVHVQPRMDLYIPQQTDDGPDVAKLTQHRTSIVKPTSGTRGNAIEDDWTTKRRATLEFEWTGSTNFEEQTHYKDEFITEDIDEQQEAKKAKGLPTPPQPTEQERMEHKLTHLPYRSWCPVCVRSKGRADNHPKQHSKAPVIQVDITYYKALGETKVTPILTAVDVETGMCMAVQVEDRTQHMQYLSTCLQQFLMECGRAQATLSNTVIQSDQEDFLMALLKMTATEVGNIAVRQSPAYTSQAQGSVERFHRTLMGQIRALKLQLENNYGTHLTSKHPIMPWLVKHAAYLLNRYAVHADGNTSYYRRWNKEHKTPICEFGETVLYMLPTVKHRPKMEARFFQAIWLGKDTSTNENILGISNQIVKARAIRRQTKPEKYNKQMMDIINSTPMTTPTPTSFVVLPARHAASNKQETSTAETQTQQALELPIPRSNQQKSTPPITDVPMATSPTTHSRRTPLPIPTTAKRDVADDIAEGSSAKQPRTEQQQTAAQRPETTQEPDKTRLRVSAVTVTTKRGDKVKAVSNEDQQEVETEKILLEPWVTNTEGLNPEQTTEGMKQEIRSMKAQQVYTEVSYNTLTQEQRSKIIKSRWVLRQKGNAVRARIVAKGYTEDVNNDDIYASTPIFCVLRLLLTMSLSNRWIVRAGDISTAFLHAKAATNDLFMFPPTEFYNPEDQVVWKLNKAIYGLRSSPHAWQKHLAETLQQLGMHRLASEPNVFKTATGNAFVLCYVDDLLFLGEPTAVNKLFSDIQQHLLLRPTGDLSVGNTVNFLGRNIANKGDYYEISLADNYATELINEAGMANSKPAPAPGTKISNTEQEQALNAEEHSAYRRAVGKLQWMTYTRPDISYATKELARSLTEPTTADQQKLKHLLRYIKGTQHYKYYVRPTITATEIVPDVGVYVDSDWAGCSTTRKSTSGFVIKYMGATVRFGSRTQSTIALSSAEAELYAINTGATEALHIRSFLTEALNQKKVNIKIYTDSSSGKSIATRIGSSKKAKHIELKHLFIQQLVLNDIVRIVKINTLANPADIFTKHVATETLLRHLTEVGINTQPY